VSRGVVRQRPDRVPAFQSPASRLLPSICLGIWRRSLLAGDKLDLPGRPWPDAEPELVRLELVDDLKVAAKSRAKTDRVFLREKGR
jgi:hypothetical protein